MIRIILVFSALLLGACTTSVGHKVEQDFNAAALSDATLLYVEPDVTVYELGMAGAEEVPEWTAAATANINQHIRTYLETRTGLKVETTVDLTPVELATLEQHLALYSRVASQHLSFQGGSWPGWDSSRTSRTPTLGPGLGFLKQKTDLDLALVTVAEDYVSSGGRIASQVAYALIFGAYMPGGQSVVHTGIIDLETGDVTWTNTAVSTSHNLKDSDGARAMVEQAFAPLPKSPPAE